MGPPAVQALIDLADARGIPIAQVFHEGVTDDASDAPCLGALGIPAPECLQAVRPLSQRLEQLLQRFRCHRFYEVMVDPGLA